MFSLRLPKSGLAVVLSPPNGHTALLAAEAPMLGASLAIAVASALTSGPRGEPVDLTSVSAVDLDVLWLTLRQHLFGDWVRMDVRCSDKACRARVDIAFRISEYLAFRAPDVAREDDLSGDLEGGCPACGLAVSVPFEPARHALAELRAASLRIHADIHALASAYGWSEPEILALPQHRISRYADLVRAGGARAVSPLQPSFTEAPPITASPRASSDGDPTRLLAANDNVSRGGRSPSVAPVGAVGAAPAIGARPTSSLAPARRNGPDAAVTWIRNTDSPLLRGAESGAAPRSGNLGLHRGVLRDTEESAPPTTRAGRSRPLDLDASGGDRQPPDRHSAAAPNEACRTAPAPAPERPDLRWSAPMQPTSPGASNSAGPPSAEDASLDASIPATARGLSVPPPPPLPLPQRGALSEAPESSEVRVGPIHVHVSAPKGSSGAGNVGDRGLKRTEGSAPTGAKSPQSLRRSFTPQLALGLRQQ